MRRWLLLLALIAFAVFSLCGCVSRKNYPSANSPVIPIFDNSHPLTGSTVQEAFVNPHQIIGSGYIRGNGESGELEIVPGRSPSFHLNLRKFLEDGQPCSDCFKITKLTHNPDDTWDVDIQITHPIPGDNTYTGFDMRLIIMFRGTEFWPASQLETQAPNSPEGYVINPDGYTTIFNPVQFPPGSGPSFLTYSPGKFSTQIYPDSTLNPYMDYYNDGNRNMIFPGQLATRTWTVKFPTGTFVLGYAIDCSWAPPDVSPPQDPQHDFPLEANKPEPFWVTADQPGILGNEVGAHTDINVSAWDWQGDIGEAWIECPGLWAGKKYHESIMENPPITTYIIAATNETGAQEGYYRALVGVTDPSQGTYPWDYTTYTFIDILVTLTTDPCCFNAPVAEFQLFDHIITGQDISLVSESYDPDGENCALDEAWDINGDGAYDDAHGQYAITSWPVPGIYSVGLMVTDSCDLSTTIVKDIQVHPGITMNEDNDYKVLDSRYNLIGAELSPSTAAAFVDITDQDGPWDFTGLPLYETDNYMACISPDNPEVQYFTDDITGTYFHFMKGSAIFNGIFGTVYMAERYDIDPDRLLWIGVHEDTNLGTFTFLPPIAQEYPLWIFSAGSYETGISLFNIQVNWEGWGEGKVTVPFGGIENADCVVMRYRVALTSPDINGLGMVYQWILDDGVSVAYVVAGNHDESSVQNIDESTWSVTGVAHYAALSSIEPY